ncbi:hypothetical protein [Botryobacter ruber]|uniref:hypothetical protein n=1 Tax=Botryobacter ruber TaxID=2171629 RepID=UPI000E0A4A7F|nr:hypothetical protein [Botryobacter ruber]
MENNWDNRNRRDDLDNRYQRRLDYDRQRYEKQRYENMPPQDPDTYRGAYRFDISSDHRNVSTYYGFGGASHPDERRQAPAAERNRRDTGGPYTASQGRQYRNEYPGDRYGNAYRGEWEEPDTPGWRDYLDHRDNWGSSNFYNDYGPDHYPHIEGENTGNMAGSLSYGYDGDWVSNPDYDRRYNPLTGEVRHEQEIRHRRHQGRNPSYYRMHDLNEDRRRY